MNSDKILAAVLALGAVTGAAQATAVSVTQTVSLGQLLNGSSSAINFDLNSSLATNGFKSENILSANLIVYGLSDPNYTNTTQAYGGYFQTGSTSHSVGYTYSTYYSCGFWGYSTCEDVHYASYGVNDQILLHQRDISHVDNVTDQLKITAGATSASGYDSVSASSATGYYGRFYEGQGGSYNYGYQYYYAEQRDVYQSISGPLSASLALDLAALTDVRTDGILNFGVQAVGNSTFRLQSASITYLAEVPEPATWGLFGAALGALVMIRRQRRKSQQ